MLVLEVREGILAVVRGMQGGSVVESAEMSVFILILSSLNSRLGMKLCGLCMFYATGVWLWC
jgi:hypothetical protein